MASPDLALYLPTPSTTTLLLLVWLKSTTAHFILPQQAKLFTGQGPCHPPACCSRYLPGQSAQVAAGTDPCH